MLTNVTINGNTATSGGGIFNFTLTGTSTLKNTILNNNGGGNCNGLRLRQQVITFPVIIPVGSQEQVTLTIPTHFLEL